ncbi:hypothetical protein SLA2020_327660 [Shorea laevis]
MARQHVDVRLSVDEKRLPNGQLPDHHGLLPLFNLLPTSLVFLGFLKQQDPLQYTRGGGSFALFTSTGSSQLGEVSSKF